MTVLLDGRRIGLFYVWCMFGLFHDVLHWKSLACICLSLQSVGRHVYVNLMGRCSGVTVDPIVCEIHNVYI